MALTPKQEEFCYAFCGNGYNATEAYAAVYAESKSREAQRISATRLMKLADVKEKIKEIRQEKLDEMQIDANRVTEKLAEIAFSKKGDEYYNASAKLKALDILSKQFGSQTLKTENKDVIEVGVIE